MDARQQVAFAPFFLSIARLLRTTWSKASAQHIAFLLQAEQGEAYRRLALLQRGGDARHWQGAEAAKPCTQQLDPGGLLGPDLVEALRRLDRRFQLGLRVERQQSRQAFGRQPQRRLPRQLQAGRAPGFAQLCQPGRPAGIGLRLGLGDAAQAQQGLMHLIGIAHCGPGFCGHRRDGVEIQRAEVVGRFRVAPAAILHRLGAALLQRRVVEETVGPGAEDFRCKRRGRRQVAGD